jgi:hypothetical protein
MTSWPSWAASHRIVPSTSSGSSAYPLVDVVQASVSSRGRCEKPFLSLRHKSAYRVHHG